MSNISFDSFEEFVSSKETLSRKISVDTFYIDLVDDLNTGLLLNQIIYWYSPSKSGDSIKGNKLRVRKEGHLWIAKGREDWYDEIRITKRQYDRCRKVLEDDYGIIEVKKFKFNGERTLHTRLLKEKFMKLVNDFLSPEKKVKESQDKKEPTSPDMTGNNTFVGDTYENVRPVLHFGRYDLRNRKTHLRKCNLGFTESGRPLTGLTTMLTTKPTTEHTTGLSSEEEEIAKYFSKIFQTEPNDIQLEEIMDFDLPDKIILKTIKVCGLYGAKHPIYLFDRLEEVEEEGLTNPRSVKSFFRNQSKKKYKPNESVNFDYDNLEEKYGDKELPDFGDEKQKGQTDIGIELNNIDRLKDYTAVTVWNNVFNILTLSEDVKKTFKEHFKPIKIGDDKLHIKTSNAYLEDWFKNRFLKLFEKILFKLTGNNLGIKITKN